MQFLAPLEKNNQEVTLYLICCSLWLFEHVYAETCAYPHITHTISKGIQDAQVKQASEL